MSCQYMKDQVLGNYLTRDITTPGRIGGLLQKVVNPLLNFDHNPKTKRNYFFILICIRALQFMSLSHHIAI